MSAEISADEAELLRLERALAERDLTAVGGQLASLLDDDFFEFGASGRLWDRAATLAALEAGPTRSVEIVDSVVRRLSPEVALLTYRIGGPTPSLRSSIWVRRGSRWRIVFHQGTAAK